MPKRSDTKHALNTALQTFFRQTATTPYRVQQIQKHFTILQQQELTDTEALDLLDLVDNVIIGFEETVTHHLLPLQQIRDCLTEQVDAYLSRRAEEAKCRTMTAMEDHIEEEFIPDVKSKEEEKVLTRESTQTMFRQYRRKAAAKSLVK